MKPRRVKSAELRVVTRKQAMEALERLRTDPKRVYVDWGEKIVRAYIEKLESEIERLDRAS